MNRTVKERAKENGVKQTNIYNSLQLDIYIFIAHYSDCARSCMVLVGPCDKATLITSDDLNYKNKVCNK